MNLLDVIPLPGLSGRPRIAYAPIIAGAICSVAWLLGLSILPSPTNVHPSGMDVLSQYAGHEWALAARFLLTQGIASIALIAVVVLFARACPNESTRNSVKTMLVAATFAASIALVQCSLGVYLAATVVPNHDASMAGWLQEAFNRLDGLKMFALGTMAMVGSHIGKQTALLPRWLQSAGMVLGVAIFVSGAGYITLNSPLAHAAWVSLPLLLVWVTGVGTVLGLATR